MPRPEALYTSNHWTFEIEGLVLPNFQKLEGLSKKTGQIKVVDGATNVTHKFSSQIMDFGEITLTRPLDGSIDDDTLDILSRASMEEGVRIDGNLVKYHFGKEVFRIAFFGLALIEETHPSLDTSAEERYDIQYKFTVSRWEKVRT